MRGPIDYLVIGFKNQKFDGSVLHELSRAIDDGVINVLALSVIEKDKDGNVNTLDMVDTQDDYFAEFTQKIKAKSDVVDQEDIDEVSDLLEENEAAGLLVIEHIWAKPLKKAILDANGFLIAEGRIHPEAAKDLEDK